MVNRKSYLGPVVVSLTIVLCVLVLAIHMKRQGDAAHYKYDISELEKIDPEHKVCTETDQIKVPFKKLRAVAVGPEDEIYVAGDEGLIVFSAGGEELRRLDIGVKALCLAVSENVAYMGTEAGIVVLGDLGGEHASTTWSPPADDAWLTSIAVTDDSVFVADFANRAVWHYDLKGGLLGRIEAVAQGDEKPMFYCPSPYFDIAVGIDDSVWVANTGRHRLENYRANGEFVGSWGKSSPFLSGFAGCCNPSHMAIRPDGRFVTCEKGFVRVKLFSPSGELIGVVAGPDQFRKNALGLDVAIDSRNRMLILDPPSKSVRVFEDKENIGQDQQD
jgi:hypothetical protein